MKKSDMSESNEYKLSGLQKTWIFIVCFFLYMINNADRQVLSAVMEPMKLDLGLSDTQMGILQSAFILSMAVFSFPLAYIVDRWSRRKMLTVMAMVWSVFTFVTGMGRSFLGVVLPRSLVAVGEAGFPAAATSMLSAAFQGQSRSRILGGFHASLPLGFAIGAGLGGYLSAHHGGWRTPFFLFAAPGILFGILAFFLKDYKSVKTVEESGKKLNLLSAATTLLRIPTLRWMWVGYALERATTFAFAAWGASLVMRCQGVSEAKGGMILGLASLMGIVGSPVGGLVADMWQKKNRKARLYTPMIAALTEGIVLALAITLELKGLGLFLALVWGFMMSVGFGGISAVTQDVVAPALRGISWGMCGFMMMALGGAWAPWIIGIGSDALGGGTHGLKMSLLLACGFTIVACLCFWGASRHYCSDMDRVKITTLVSDK